MNKIFLVIQREYLTRVKKTSFWVLTILVPLLMAALYSVPIYLATNPMKHTKVLVVDETTLFERSFESSDEIAYSDAGSLDYAKQMLEADSADAVVFVPARETTIPNDAYLYYRSDAPGINVQSDVENQLQTILRDNILLDVHGISPEDYAMIRDTRVNLHTQDLETGRDSLLEIKIAVGLALAVVIFMAIFLFGSQVMRGVMEEKSNRVVEVILSSVRPFQLMAGKVVGIAMVGLTQFLLWLLLGGIAIGGITLMNVDLFDRAEQQQITEIATKGAEATAQLEAAQAAVPVPDSIVGLASIDFGVLLSAFLFYFVCGYLLYAILFAAVGSVTDSETDSQQFTLPLTIPLLITFLLVPSMINEPSGSLATWLSIIPFTSPVAMMFRIPFGVPIWEVALSMVLLAAFVPLCTWVASKIYRMGILRYGQKTTWADLLKWLRL